MKELTELFMHQVKQLSVGACDTFVSIISNWQDYTNAEKIEYINSLDNDALSGLGTMGAASMINFLSYIILASEGITEDTVHAFCSLCAWRILQKMDQLSLDTLDHLDHINEAIQMHAYTLMRRN